MTDETAARALFEARLRQLGLTELAPHEIERLWKNHVVQREISAGLDATLDPRTESALLLSVHHEDRR